VDRNAYDALASDHAECAICFEPLCNPEPVAVFCDRSRRRVCYHFFHLSCAQQTAQISGDCPLCRASFASVLPVPEIKDDAQAWFQVCDKDGDGSLNPREVLEIIKAQFPVDYEKLERDLPRLWTRFDPNMDGQIQREEFLAPNGLLSFIRTHFLKENAPAAPVPDIRTDKHGWFSYFDEDVSGELSVQEVTRGLIKSYHLNQDIQSVNRLREIVSNIWCIFDADGSGEISREEFLLPNEGLADSIVASFAH